MYWVPSVNSLDSGEWASTLTKDRRNSRSGRQLMRLPPGLHHLSRDREDADTVIIGVHGFGARGYEWTHPLQVLEKTDADLHFYRWDYILGTKASRKKFLEQLHELVRNRKRPIDRIVFLSHSCGGVLTVSSLSAFPRDIDYEIHVIASPLRGMSIIDVCPATLPAKIPDNIKLTQWRTKKQLDKVFWLFPQDPQDVDLQPSKVEVLPSQIRGKILGHVRSLTWVAERLVEEQLGSQLVQLN